ncbi:hypothetical protein E2C01_059903 [Portunus trituberculatus]|uniref:Uncharacterized protein n=1 Tax=Portunus trituberculatus TaxID=210409 RepID=A0A5B7H918_PORTR|nr:hypothetical protein [Portunus trituberculatus]
MGEWHSTRRKWRHEKKMRKNQEEMDDITGRNEKKGHQGVGAKRPARLTSCHAAQQVSPGSRFSVKF